MPDVSSDCCVNFVNYGKSGYEYNPTLHFIINCLILLTPFNNVFTNYFNIITYITKLFKRTKSSQALAGFSKFIA